MCAGLQDRYRPLCGTPGVLPRLLGSVQCWQPGLQRAHRSQGARIPLVPDAQQPPEPHGGDRLW